MSSDRIIKVCFYGAESTGKSTMAKKLAARFQTEYVPEVARELILSNDFTLDDIIRIGHAQTQRVLDKLQNANRVLFCDTDLITTQIYSRQYLQIVPPILYQLEKQISYDDYFLFDIDTEWVADGLRDLGNQRESMHHIFKKELDSRSISYHFLHGTWEDKEQHIVETLKTKWNLEPYR